MKRRTLLGGLTGAAFYGEFLGIARAQGTSAAPKLKIREIRAVRLRDGLKSITSLTDPVALTDGYLVPSDKPGIGVALNDDAVKERTESEFRPL
jgi:L-alanine-DL-glutamate epimerase-like enolase superfamily enzyme